MEWRGLWAARARLGTVFTVLTQFGDKRLRFLDLHYFGGNVPVNVVARRTHVRNSSSSSTPPGSTITHPFMERPVMSNSLTHGSLNAPSY